MRRREFLLGAVALALAPVSARASRTLSRPALRDDPETPVLRNPIGLSIGAASVVYLIWFSVAKFASRRHGAGK